MNKGTIIIIVGHSGSGKSTLSKALGEVLECDVLSFSYAGKVLSKVEIHSETFQSTNRYIFNCIRTEALKKPVIIVDGLASDAIINELSNEGFTEIIMFVDTPYEKRITRIMNRESCSKSEAIAIEKYKEMGKEKSGLSTAIGLSHLTIDGSLQKEAITQIALDYIKEIMSSDFEK